MEGTGVVLPRVGTTAPTSRRMRAPGSRGGPGLEAGMEEGRRGIGSWTVTPSSRRSSGRRRAPLPRPVSRRPPRGHRRLGRRWATDHAAEASTLTQPPDRAGLGWPIPGDEDAAVFRRIGKRVASSVRSPKTSTARTTSHPRALRALISGPSTFSSVNRAKRPGAPSRPFA